LDTHTISNAELQQVLSLFKDVAEGWTGGPWTWDGRFAVPVSIVRPPFTDIALDHLRAVMPFEFDSTAHSHLPDQLASVCARSGGLRPGQLAFCDTVHPAGGLRYCLWWPWNSGGTASLRIGLTG